MPTPRIPTPVPEVPVRDVRASINYYVTALGFTQDWCDPASDIAGISQGDRRLFLTSPSFRQTYGTSDGPLVMWLNLSSKQEVDELYARRQQSGVTLLSEPEDKPWNLREFRAADPDGNQLRVFYDFSRDVNV